MSTSRRGVLTGVAGLAGSVLALPAPAEAQATPFCIEPSANYLELRRLTVLINENHQQRYWTPNVGKAAARRLDKHSQLYWERIQVLLERMAAQPPRTPSALLDYAAVMLWHTTGLGWGLTGDPCEALARVSGDAVGRREYHELQVAWGIFAMAADRSQPAAVWPACQPLPLRDGPGTEDFV